MAMVIFWIIIAIVVLGLIVYYLKQKKKCPELPEKPETPSKPSDFPKPPSEEPPIS